MRGPACVLWADLTPFSLQARVAASAALRQQIGQPAAAPGGLAVRPHAWRIGRQRSRTGAAAAVEATRRRELAVRAAAAAEAAAAADAVDLWGRLDPEYGQTEAVSLVPPPVGRPAAATAVLPDAAVAAALALQETVEDVAARAAAEVAAQRQRTFALLRMPSIPKKRPAVAPAPIVRPPACDGAASTPAAVRRSREAVALAAGPREQAGATAELRAAPTRGVRQPGHPSAWHHRSRPAKTCRPGEEGEVAARPKQPRTSNAVAVQSAHKGHGAALGLPPGWVEGRSKSRGGRPYYVHAETGRKTWHRPQDEAPPRPPPAPAATAASVPPTKASRAAGPPPPPRVAQLPHPAAAASPAAAALVDAGDGSGSRPRRAPAVEVARVTVYSNAALTVEAAAGAGPGRNI
jgi:hypothetical protein